MCIGYPAVKRHLSLSEDIAYKETNRGPIMSLPFLRTSCPGVASEKAKVSVSFSVPLLLLERNLYLQHHILQKHSSAFGCTVGQGAKVQVSLPSLGFSRNNFFS